MGTESIFPDPEFADENGVLCIGGNLNANTLIDAYTHGIFPWPHDGFPLLWFSPPHRGIIFYDMLHIPRRLARFRKSWKGDIRFDTAFDQVIEACASMDRKGQMGTWITPDIKAAYNDFHRAGYAHCVEAWEDNDLVAGLYGVFIGNVFSAESMFYKKSNCSKLCLIHLVDHLYGRGITWLDIQTLTPVTIQLGGIYIPRADFLDIVKEQQSKEAVPFL